MDGQQVSRAAWSTDNYGLRVGWPVLLILASLLLAACRSEPAQQPFSTPVNVETVEPASHTPLTTASKTLLPSQTATEMLVPSLTASRTVTDAPSETPAPTLRDDLKNLVSSPEWEALALPAEIVLRWETYARTGIELSDAEMSQLEAFMALWRQLQDKARASDAKRIGTLAYRVWVTGDGPGATLLPYAIDANAPAELARPYLTVYTQDGRGVRLAPAPVVDDLTPRLAPDGVKIEYVNKDGEVMLLADAEQLEEKVERDDLLLDRLRTIYKDRVYTPAMNFPRYRMPVDGIEASFFGLERSLSGTQILLLLDALSLFDRPEFVPLKQAFFGPETSILIPPEIDVAAGLTYIGTGVVELDRRDLFGSRYEVAEVLAHEGAHVLQGKGSAKNSCSERLRREVGNKTIPDDFYRWDAEQLLEAVRAETAGAYHVSLWMLMRLGVNDERLDILKDIIYTGRLFGASVVLGC